MTARPAADRAGVSPTMLGQREPRALAYAAAGQFAFGSAQSLVGLFLFGMQRSDAARGLLIGAVVSCTVAAALLFALGDRVPWWVSFAGGVVGTGFLMAMSDAMWGDTIVLLFLPQIVVIALTVAIFCSGPVVTYYLGYALVVWGAVCAHREPAGQALGSWLAVGPSLVIVSVIARWLVGRLLQLIERDVLTGVANRGSWDSTVGRPRDGAACILHLDLDHFKQVNDTHGHAAGDALLRGVAVAWRQEVGPRDVLARLGGDEFAVLTFDTALDQGVALAERLRARVAHLTSVTIGVAERHGGEPLADVLARADAALYEAKRSGRGRVRAAPSAGAPTVVGVD